MKRKKIIGMASGGLAAALMAVTIFNNMNTVVHAKEVFTDIKVIRSEAEGTEPFDVLEIVDKKSVFIKNAEGNLEITIGEDKFSYYVGGQEPFRELTNQLAEESRKFYYGDDQYSWQENLDFSDSAANDTYIKKAQQEYSAIVTELASSGFINPEADITVDPEDYAASADFPLSRIKKETYLPANFDFLGTSFYIEKKSIVGDNDDEAEGYFAPAMGTPGCYEWDASEQKFIYVGNLGQYSTAMIDILINDYEPEDEGSVSDNSDVSGNSTVSGNDSENPDDITGDDTTGDDTTGDDTTGDDTTEEDTTEDDTTGDDTTGENTTGDDTTGDDTTGDDTTGDDTTGDDTTGDDTTGDDTTGDDTTGDDTTGDDTTGNDTTTPESLEEEDEGKEHEETETVITEEQSASSVNNRLWKVERVERHMPILGADNNIGVSYYNYYPKLEDIPEEIKNDDQLSKMIVEINTVTPAEGENRKMISDAEIYKTTYLGIQNNEWFKEHVFGLGLDETREGYEAVHRMKVNVTVTLPDLDNNKDTVDDELNTLIDNTDLLYLNVDRNPEATTLNPASVDMNAQTAMKIAERATSQEKNLLLPCIVNADAYTLYNTMQPEDASGIPVNEELYNSNINKLMHLLYSENIYLNYSDTEINSTNWNENLDSVGGKWQSILDKNLIWKDNISKDVAGNISTDNSFVIENVFFMKMDAVTPLSGVIVTYGEDVDSAYEAVYVCIEQENYAREQEAVLNNNAQVETVPKEITYGSSIQTILVYSPTPAVILKSSIRVLELQPCYDFTYARVRTDSDTTANNKIKRFKKDFFSEGEDSNVNVEIIGMTTAEFCGKIEDINVEYDMIYIGTNTGMMNRETSLNHSSLHGNSVTTSTVYNDTAMNGVVYVHTGDLFQIKDTSRGLLQKNNAYARYSGNDILRNQKDKLLEFMECGSPIILEEDLFFWNGNNITISTGNTTEEVKNVTRKGTLDSSTYLYQFIKTAFTSTDKKYDNLLIRGSKNNAVSIYEIRKGEQRTAVEIGTSGLSKWLNQPKLAIQMMSQPVEYSYSTKNVAVNGKNVDCITDCNYLMADDNGSYYLTYEFVIQNLASQKPASTTYSVELFIDANLDGKFSKTKEKMAGDELKVTRLSDGKAVDFRQLKVGEGYHVTRRLPADYIGVVPWKLEITDNGNSTLRSSVNGISAISEENTQEIRILQLQVGSNLESLSKDKNSLWKVLLENVPNRKITIKSINAANYFSGTANTNVNLDDYDMLILGFTDMYLSTHSPFDQNRLNAVINYAKSGKCVLFSHDNTSWMNGSGRNGTLDMAIRDLTGLDRYGTTVGRNSNGFSANNKVNQGNDIQANSVDALRNTIFSGDLTGKNRDIAFSLNSDQKSMTKETQGFTYAGITQYHENTNGYPLKYLKFNHSLASSTWNPGNNCRITKVNEGAITSYPYDLPDVIITQPTHAQYNQLDLESDMDGDNETDIVVWYCISDTVEATNPTTHNDIFDYSPNDVRNNYYIYNHGNITYTGMGHRAINNEYEIKLFINVMMAAYQVSLKAPDISIVEGIGNNTEKTYDAIPYDKNLYGSETQEYKDTTEKYRVYFYVEDNNLVPSDMKTIEYQILKRVQSGNNQVVIDGEQMVVEDMTSNTDWIVYDSSGNVCPRGDRLLSGRYYYLEFPLQGNLTEAAGLDIYLRAQSYIDYEGNGKATPSPASTDTIRLHQIKLFDLD